MGKILWSVCIYVILNYLSPKSRKRSLGLIHVAIGDHELANSHGHLGSRLCKEEPTELIIGPIAKMYVLELTKLPRFFVNLKILAT